MSFLKRSTRTFFKRYKMALNANALVTLALAKSFLKIPTAETSKDALVEFFINAASDYIETETDRRLKSQAITEFQHGRQTNIILLKQYPVTAISGLYFDSTGKYSGDQETVDVSLYTIGDDSNSLVYTGGYFPRGYNNIKVVYTAGFAAVPSDLQNATLWLVSFYYKMQDNGDIGRTSKGKGDESIQILQEAPMEVKNAILRYRRSEVPLSNAMAYNG